MSSPVASIVVCTRDRSASLVGALEDLVDQQMDGGRSFEVVVVDDGSMDDTAEVVDRFARHATAVVRRLDGGGRGVAHARNVGVIDARGEWIAFFDDDQRTDGAWLSRLIETAEADGADVVGGPIDVRLPPEATPGPVVRALYGEHPTQRERSRGVIPLPGGGNRLLHRSVFERIGPHDESLQVGEDLDLLVRSVEAGLSFGWAPQARVWHVIPEERLGPAAVLAYADRAGRARGTIDAAHLDRRRLVSAVAVALAKLALNLGVLAVAAARRAPADVLDARARSALLRGYLRALAASVGRRSASDR